MKSDVPTLSMLRDRARQRGWGPVADAYQIAIDSLAPASEAPGELTIEQMIAATEKQRELWRGHFDPAVFLSMTAVINRLREAQSTITRCGGVPTSGVT